MPTDDGPSCDACQWGDVAVLNVEDVGPDAVLLCRRNPPTPVFDTADGGGVATAWPVVSSREWCGEWTEKGTRWPAPR